MNDPRVQNDQAPGATAAPVPPASEPTATADALLAGLADEFVAR